MSDGPSQRDADGSDDALVALDDLVFHYPGSTFRLDIPRLRIEAGASVACIGPSGSGKTTLLNLIAGIASPAAGRVRVGDVEVSALGDEGRRRFRIRAIGLVFQEFELLGYLDVLDNVVLPYRINAALRLDQDVRARAEELVRLVGLGDKLGRRTDRLSQGEKQRVAVCRALLPEPSLLLADEPTGNLDPSNKGRVLDLLFEYAAERGATIVTVTHDHELLDRFARVIDFRDLGAVDAPAPGAAS